MPTEENKAIIGRVAEAFSKGDVASIDELYAPDFVDHDASPGTPPGRESLKQLWPVLHRAFPDLQLRIEDVIAEADKVASRATFRGTHQGDLFGIPPTGRRVIMIEMALWRIEDGKIAEWWHVTDQLGMLQQLGVAPPPASGK